MQNANMPTYILLGLPPFENLQNIQFRCASTERKGTVWRWISFSPAHLNRPEINNSSVLEIQWFHVKALIKSFQISTHSICL